MQVLTSIDSFLDEWAIALFKPVAVAGVLIGGGVYALIGVYVLLTAPLALVLLASGLLLDPVEHAPFKGVCSTLMLGLGWLLIWCFFAGLLIGGLQAWTK